MDLILQRTFLGNSLLSYLWFFGIILAGLIFKRGLSVLLTLTLFKFFKKKYSTGVGYKQLLELLRRPVGMLILLITFYLAFDMLEFPSEWNLVPSEKFGWRMVLFSSFQIAIVLAITWILLRFIDFLGLVIVYKASLTQSKSDDQLVPFIRDSIKVVVVILSVFFILGAIFKLNVASLIAGLGIGGLAIALAAKESIENLIGSFAIFLDRPFVVGDVIRVGSLEGTVETIGFRSTRLRTAEKSFVTVPNKKLVDSELDNLSLRSQRRVLFNITLIPHTNQTQIKNIVGDLQGYITNHVHVYKENIYVRFHDFNPAGVNILVSYFVNTMEYDVYLNVREEINYKIIEIINKHESAIAYATPTIVTNRDK